MSWLEDTVVVVADDTGRESADVVDAFLNAGATVVLFSHVEPADEEMGGFTVSTEADGLVVVTGDFERIDEVEQVRDELLARFGRIDALVVSMNTRGHVGQRIVEMTLTAYWSALTGHLLRNFVVTRTFYPVVADAPNGGHCVFVNDAVSEIPQSHAGPRCVAAAAQRMFTCMLLEESSTTNGTPRISEICSYGQMWTETVQREPDSRGNKSVGTVAAEIVSGETDTHGEVVRV